MIANRIGLYVATALALVLAVIVIAGGGADAPTSRELVTGFDTDKLARLAWSRSGEPELVLERAGTQWRWTKPIADIPANPATLDALVAALRGGRWHRREPIAKAGTLSVALVATAGTRTLKLGVGDALEGAGQTWIAIDDHAYLVDDWIARALSPAPLALREPRPFKDVAAAQTIVLDRVVPYQFAVRIEGTPRTMVRPIHVLLNAHAAATLQHALATLTIIGLPEKIGGDDTFVAMTITIDTPRLVTVEVIAGGCKVGVAIGGTFGPGCIADEAWAAVEEAIKLLRMPSTVLADPQPLRIEPVKITLPDGGVLDLEKRPRIGDRDADPAAVAELLAVLQLARTVVDSDPAIQPIGTLVAADRAGTTITLELLPGNRLRRRGEPVALELGAGAAEILRRPSAALGDPTLWSEDEFTIRSITIDQTTFTRGAVVGEWTPASTTADDLARALAKLRATPAARAPAKILHTVSFETAPPTGAPITRTLQLGERCVAVVDARPVQLEPRFCALVAKGL